MPWKERKGNRWRILWRKDGKKQPPRYFKDEDDADHFLDSLRAPRPLTSAELVARFSGKTPAPRTPKFIDYTRDLVETGDIGQGTKDGYRSTIRNHLEGTALSDMRLAEITAQDVRSYWSKITPRKTYDRGGDGAKGNVYTLLAKSFNQAVWDGIIPISPLKQARIKRPSKKRATEVEPLSIPEVEELAAATVSERDRLAILVGGYCGLRGGEVGGLRKRDINAKDCRLTIMQAVKRDSAGVHVGLPKGNKTRTIIIPCSIALDLAEFAKGAVSDGRVFYTQDGGLIDHIKTNKISQAAAKKAGREAVNFHSLRHSCASLLASKGADSVAVSRYLGHANIETTLRLYRHLFEDEGQDLADRMERGRQEYLDQIKAL